MDPHIEKTITENVMNNIQTESILNRENDELPYGYFNPSTEGKLTWICGPDADGKITSIFCYDHGTNQDKRPEYIDNIEKARFIREELIKNGWKKIIPPKITFTYPGEKEGKPLNRRQKRSLKKKLKHMNQQNPFEITRGSLQDKPPHI